MLDKSQAQMAVAMPMSPNLDATMLPSLVNTKERQQQQQQQQQQQRENDIELQINLKKTKTKANANASPTRKAKNILNWLKGATTQTTTKTSDYKRSNCNKNNKSAKKLHKEDTEDEEGEEERTPIADDKNCTCRGEKTRATSARFSTDGTLRDFRGVQTLRHLWNKRISCASEAILLQQQQQQERQTNKLRKLNKSVSCIVNEINNARDLSQFDFVDTKESRTKRALSLHDCTQLSEDHTSNKVVGIEQTDIDIDCLHRVKDNFYKYKNAEQARLKTRRLSIETAAMLEDPHFPAVKTSERGEHIQWPKRKDIIMCGLKRSAAATEALSASDVITVSNDANVGRTVSNNSSSETSSMSGENTLTAGSSPLHDNVSLRERTLACGRSNLSSASGSKRGSKESLSSCSVQSASTGSIAAGSKSRTSGTRRKYSFKTHAGKAFHHRHSQVTRRTSMRDKDGVATTTAHSGHSMVAKLTQQFNEIIQKDKHLLEEVKRNKGVWMARGTHVYKVVEQSSTGPSSGNHSPSASRNNSQSSSLVQCAIDKFEKSNLRSSDARSLPKPVVPAKSSQVLRKHQELIAHNRPSNLNLGSRSKRINQSKLQLPPSDLKLPVVREEAKTPLESEPQKSIVVEEDHQPEIRGEPGDIPQSATVQNEAAKAEVVNDMPPTVEEEEVVTICSAKEINVADTEAVDVADASDVTVEKTKQNKHKYAKIYEKFRFRKPFSGGCQQKNKTPVESTDIETPAEAEIITAQALEKPPLDTGNEIETKAEGEAKILDALEAIDQKIKGLTQSSTEGPTELLLKVDDDFEQRILPNSSFVHQAAQVSNNQLLVTQAVNVALVNAIEGEQMIMEQKELHTAKQEAVVAVPLHVDTKEDEPIYEPIVSKAGETSKTEPQKSFLFCSLQKSVETVTATTVSPEPAIEDIYQTVEEAQAKSTKKPSWLEDYESIAGSCDRDTPPEPYDGYESFEKAVETPSLASTSTSGGLMRNTNDELPELPKPKRRLPKSPMPGKRDPPIKPKTSEQELEKSDMKGPTAEPEEHHYYADQDDDEEENIYDTIKGGSNCYESIQKSASSGSSTMRACTDSISVVSSNCYESISHYRRSSNAGVTVSSGGSTLTISSDHKTNSLYEVSLAAGMLYGTGSLGCRSSMCSSAAGSGSSGQSCAGVSLVDAHAASSDNSDEWIDISDAEVERTTNSNGEEMEAKRQFIVVRERSKAHRSPDWSKRIRDKRMQQKKAISYIEDDSDHYYETLSPPLGNKRSSNSLPRTQSEQQKCIEELRRHEVNTHKHNNHLQAVSDDYDSFTDTDEHEEHTTNQNDSGVDIRNLRLPEPPQSTNQVYAIVRKLKNFISSKKSPSSGSQQKLYENTSQFYVENAGGQDRKLKPKSKSIKEAKKLPLPKSPTDIYENTEFHLPPAINNAKDTKKLSTSEKNLLSSSGQSDIQNPETPPSITTRSKTVGSKSFSRLRKSLGGSSSSETKHLSTLTSSRSTFYLEDPVQHGSGQFDSGFIEKTSSGDIPNPQQKNNVSSAEAQKFSTVARKAKKAKEANNAQRRRTTIGIRPHEPPPPPPEDKTRKSTSSWYAECGVFKQSTQLINGGSSTLEESLLSESGGNKSTSNSQSGISGGGSNSWYTEAGLYQTSGVSVASSSGSSGVSTGNEAGLGDEGSHSLFLNEPLYQIYNAAKLESITRDLEDHEGSIDGYEEVGHLKRTSKSNSNDSEVRKSLRPSALQLVEPTNGPSRTLWSQIPEVINSFILPSLSPRERALQEAKFEVITSEASYLKSLNLLRSHFMNNAAFRDTNILSSRDRKALFSYIVPVHECSERLLTELESCWQDNIMLLGLSKRIYSIAEKNFHVYISFCEHQGRMDRTLRRLKETKGSFQQHLEKLESSATCCGLNLHSFLMLPMQRITRLPLLIDAVFSKVPPNDDEHDNWKMTLAIMNKIVTQCNEAANRCEQAYEIERISRQLEFPSSIRALAIAPVGVPVQGSKPRFLVKKGELTHLVWRGDDAKLTFGKRFSKSTIYAFLFSDLLVLTKRKGQEQFTVIDYCPRSMLTISTGDALPQLPTKDINQAGKNLILMTLLENHERKTVELVLSCPSVSEQERWLQAMRPPEAETPGEKLYESWDCPQVITKHTYESNEPDVLNLELGDVVNVTRKLPDGWYQGERIRDGAIGWFPGSFTEEVNSAHVRARNLKQRYRLLTFTATYLESQKKK